MTLQETVVQKQRQRWHDYSAEFTLAELKATPAGLSEQEAAVRLEAYGPNRLPVSALLRRDLHSSVAQSALLAGGDDYELSFTAAPAKHAAVERAALRASARVTRIGRVIRAPAGAYSVVVVDRDGLPLPLQQKGFDHFG